LDWLENLAWAAGGVLDWLENLAEAMPPPLFFSPEPGAMQWGVPRNAKRARSCPRPAAPAENFGGRCRVGKLSVCVSLCWESGARIQILYILAAAFRIPLCLAPPDPPPSPAETPPQPFPFVPSLSSCTSISFSLFSRLRFLLPSLISSSLLPHPLHPLHLAFFLSSLHLLTTSSSSLSFSLLPPTRGPRKKDPKKRSEKKICFAAYGLCEICVVKDRSPGDTASETAATVAVNCPSIHTPMDALETTSQR
jgi:hypothetical protein